MNQKQLGAVHKLRNGFGREGVRQNVTICYIGEGGGCSIDVFT